MAFSLSPGVNSLESELRPIGSKEPHQDILRDAPQLVSISGLSSDLHSKMVSTYDSGWGGALEPMEHTDCLLRGLPQSGGSSVQMQLWSTNDSAALPAAPSSASLSSVASTNTNTNTNAVAAAAAAAAAVLVDEPCTWTNVRGQATTLPAANNNNNTTTTNNNSDGSTGSRQTTATATPTQPPLQQPQPPQSQAAPQQAQAQAPQMPQQPFLFAPQDYAGMQPMTTWFMPSPGGAGGFTQCVAMPALGTPQSASLLPLPPPPPATVPHSSSTHVDCGGAATATAAAAAGYQALWQPSLSPAAGANAQTTMNSAQAMAEMPRWVPCMPGQQFVQLPQGFAMATAAAQGSNSNGAMAGPELSGQTHVLHHDPSSSSSPSSMFLPMQAGMPYVLLMPTTTTTTATTTAAGPTLPQQQQTQQTPQTQVITPGWAALPPPPPPLSPALPSLQPASIQTPSSHTLPSNASTPQARHSDKLPAQATQSPASNATSFVAAHTPSHQALSSLPGATPTLGPLLYAAAPPMPPHTHTHTTNNNNNNNNNALMQQQMNAEKEARATPAYVSPSHVQQQQQHMMQPHHHHHPQMHFLPPPPPPPLPGVDTMHALPSQASACMSRPIALPTPPWLLPAPASSSSTSSSTTPATSMTPPTATAASTTTTMTGMVQTQTTPSTGHAAQTTAHVKAWMGVNDQWRPLVFGY